MKSLLLSSLASLALITSANSTVVHPGETWAISSPGSMAGTIVEAFIFIPSTFTPPPSFSADWFGSIRKDLCSCWADSIALTINSNPPTIHGTLHGGFNSVFIGDQGGNGDFHLTSMTIYNISSTADIQFPSGGSLSQIQPIPLPSSIILFLSSLLLFFKWRTRS